MRFVRPFISWPLRGQIALVTSLIALSVALSIGAGALITSRTHTVNLVRADLTSVAGAMADRVGRGVEQRVREIAFLAELEPIRDNWRSSPMTIRKVLDLLQDGAGIYGWIGFADMNGLVLAGTDGLLEGTIQRQTPWFERGLVGAHVGDVYAAMHLPRPKGSNAAPQVFDVSVPVYGISGEQLGVLGAQVNWTWLTGLRDAALASDLHPSTNILVARRDGTAILGAPVGTRVLSREGADLAYSRGRGTSEADGVLNAFSIMRGREGAQLGWIVIATQPKRYALAEVERMTFVSTLIGGAMGVLALFASGAFASRLARPLRALAEEADLIGSGGGANLKLHRGSEEIARLSASLRALLQRLGVEEKLRIETAEELDRRTTRLASDLRTMRDLAETDPLTRLRNRRSFTEAAVYAPRTALLALDIDHFKSVNDRFGHAAGDEILKQVARKIAHGVRGTDLAARFGGEEFIVLLRGVGPARARMLAERMREDIEKSVKLPDGGPVTVSLGVAAWPENQSLDHVLGAADIELYRAKQLGRNRVCVAGEKAA